MKVIGSVNIFHMEETNILIKNTHLNVLKFNELMNITLKKPKLKNLYAFSRHQCFVLVLQDKSKCMQTVYILLSTVHAVHL